METASVQHRKDSNRCSLHSGYCTLFVPGCAVLSDVQQHWAWFAHLCSHEVEVDVYTAHCSKPMSAGAQALYLP